MSTTRKKTSYTREFKTQYLKDLKNLQMIQLQVYLKNSESLELQYINGLRKLKLIKTKPQLIISPLASGVLKINSM